MLPLIISGVSFGVIAYVILPEIIAMISLVGVLGYLSYGVFNKALDMRKNENVN